MNSNCIDMNGYPLRREAALEIALEDTREFTFEEIMELRLIAAGVTRVRNNIAPVEVQNAHASPL